MMPSERLTKLTPSRLPVRAIPTNLYSLIIGNAHLRFAKVGYNMPESAASVEGRVQEK